MPTDANCRMQPSKFICFPIAAESGKHNSAHPFGWDVQKMGASGAILHEDHLEEHNPLHTAVAPMLLLWAYSTCTKERTMFDVLA
jgi:hypothetical protein